MPIRARGNAAKCLILIAFFPLALGTGLVYGLIAQKFSKGREPWFTLLMLIGLAGTICALQWLGGDFHARTPWLFLGTASLYIGLRFLFGNEGGQPIEAFILPHICAILLCFLFPTLDQIKAKRSRQMNAPETHLR